MLVGGTFVAVAASAHRWTSWEALLAYVCFAAAAACGIAAAAGWPFSLRHVSGVLASSAQALKPWGRRERLATASEPPPRPIPALIEITEVEQFDNPTHDLWQRGWAIIRLSLVITNRDTSQVLSLRFKLHSPELPGYERVNTPCEPHDEVPFEVEPMRTRRINDLVFPIHGRERLGLAGPRPEHGGYWHIPYDKLSLSISDGVSGAETTMSLGNGQVGEG